MIRILVAPNAFKHSLTASEAAQAIAEGLHASRLQCETVLFPVADGGDGTSALIAERCAGTWVKEAVTDPLGRGIQTSYALIDEGRTALIEMADASGIRLLSNAELDPLRTTSYGTGQLIRKALDKNISKIIIGVGGSATVDGGAGILAALGVRFLDGNNNELQPHPDGLASLAFIDTSLLDKRLAGCEIVVLCDVDNYLLGDQGSAAVFGPQKGATPQSVVKLERMLGNLSEIAFRITGRDMSRIPGGGAAGGTAAGLFAFLEAKLVTGIDYFLAQTGFEEAIKDCQLVITGEGSIDVQTLNGKGPFGVALLAKQLGVPVIAVAGRVPLYPDLNLTEYFDVVMPIGNEPAVLNDALATTAANLTRTAHEIGNTLALRRL